MGSEEGRNHLISRCEEYNGNITSLPQKKDRKYYVFNDSDNRKYIISDDGLCFLWYKNNFYPVESKLITESVIKKQEENYIKKFDYEMELFEKNKIAPMAYTYIMQNIYDWYIADDAAKRAEITEKLAEFKRNKYKYTGIEFYDEGIKYLPKMPEEYKWSRMGFPQDLLHQNTAPNIITKSNKKFVSFDGYFEAVYSYDNIFLKEGHGDVDMGTYNYSPSGKNVKGHVAKDMVTYGIYKNSKQELEEQLSNLIKKYERIESR